jgi:hypothetical protein
MSKLKLWDESLSWEAAEAKWDENARQAASETPIKRLAQLPSMPGITADTAKHLKWKSLKWMLLQDHDRKVLKGFLKHPLKYGWGILKSSFQTKPYKRDGDFFLYGIDSVDELKELLENPRHLFVLGFSYCQKPFECPSGRFSPECIHDIEHPVCRQCFIGKAFHAVPHRNTVILCIPTVHYIGGKILELVHEHPDKQLLFLITACEMTLEMFGDWGNAAAIKGIGVRLDGRICNTMKAFELSERGVKPGLTVVLDAAQEKMLELIRVRREHAS